MAQSVVCGRGPVAAAVVAIVLHLLLSLAAPTGLSPSSASARSPSPAAAGERHTPERGYGGADRATLLMALAGAAALVVTVAATRRARRDRQRLRQLEGALDLVEHGFALYDAADRLVLCNRAYREIYPRSAARMVPGVRFDELIRYGVEQGEYLEARDDPEGWIAMRLALHEAADGRPMLQSLGDGRILRVSEHRTADGGRVGLRVDVTELERSRRALAESEARFRALAEHAPIGIWQLDPSGQTIYANPALCSMLERHPRALAELPPEGARPVRELLARHEQAASISFELAWPADGERETRTLAGIATPLATAAGGGLLLTFLDVTAQRRALADLEHLALHDPLTGLGNRRLFNRRAEEWLERGEPFALVLVDVDDLEAFNARFGHGEGDRLLIKFAERLQCFIRSGDLVLRLGSDEFALLVPGIGDEQGLARFIQRLAEALAEPLGAGGRPFRPRACLGGAIAPLHARTRDALLARAELALATAKQRGPGQTVLYEPGLSLARDRRLDLRWRLERAIEHEELQLFVQPQIGLADGRVRGGEILLRWFDRVEKEPVPPGEFVALAEETGLIFELDTWVLARTCAWLASCGAGADELPRLSVNLSAAHITRPKLPRFLGELLATYGIAPSRLEIEVTEHVFLNDQLLGRRLLDELHELGVELALDDFGTGYSSLAYLAELPFDRVKIDRSFVLGLGTADRRRTIVRAITGLGRGLGMEVVAEGVESAEQRDLLLEEGCDLVQGHLIARPMPLDQFKEWLRNWDAKAWCRELETVRFRGTSAKRLLIPRSVRARQTEE